MHGKWWKVPCASREVLALSASVRSRREIRNSFGITVPASRALTVPITKEQFQSSVSSVRDVLLVDGACALKRVCECFTQSPGSEEQTLA